MKLLAAFPKPAFLLCSMLFVCVSGGRKSSHHHSKSAASVAAASTPSVTPIVEADATSSISQPSLQMAQSRSAAIASERSSSSAYSQPIYSSPYDPALMSDQAISEASYYDPVVPSQHQYHHPHHSHAAASAHYPHHVPAPVATPHARHAAGAAAASVAPYAAAAAPYYGYGHQGYGYDYPARYLAQGSHQDGYIAKRAHGYGGYGWHPDLEVQTLFFIGIPLIIIPLLFLWPYFLYSLHYRGGPHGYGYRSASGSAEVLATPQKELKAKTDELTKKVLPKLSKKSDKSSKSSDKSSKSSDKSDKTEKSSKS